MTRFTPFARVLAPLLVFAVEAAEPATAPPGLEEVVVSATRSGDTLEDTPISVTITADLELRETDITDLEALSDRLPNAQLAITPTNTFLFVRGLGTGSVRSAEQSVGFFVDGVFLGRPQVALFDFLDVQQVEILRGPQGAVLGKNTVAGAVNVQTAPVSWEPEGYAEYQRGSDGRQRRRAALSGELVENLAARVAIANVDEGGFLFNTTQQRDDLARPGRSGRIKLAWTPSDNQSYGLTFQKADIEQRGDSFELSQASDETLSLYRQFDPQTSADITDNRTHTDHRDSGADIEGRDLILNAEWNLAFGSLRFLGSRSRQSTVADFDVDISPAPFLTFPSNEDYRQQSAELRFDKLFSWGDLSAGLYYFQSELDLLADINAFESGLGLFVAPLADNAIGPGVGSAAINLSGLVASPGVFNTQQTASGTSRHRLIQEQETWSGFGSVRWDFRDIWTLRVDGRYTEETKRGDLGIEFSGASGPLLGAALGEEEYQLSAERTEYDFSPRLSLLVELTPQLNSYVTAARGFKSGGFNNLAAVPERAEFDEENSVTYELGLRLSPVKGFSGELGVFKSDFKNLQVAALDGTEFFVGNAARANIRGIEASGRWQASWGLSIGFALGYLDAEYEEYSNAPARADSEESSQDLSGEVLQRAPKYSGSVQLGFQGLMPTFGLPFALGVVAEGASEQFLNVDLDPIDSQPDFLRYSAFAGVSSPSGRWNFRVVGRNLSDEVVRREAGDIAIVGAHFVGVFPPRSYAAEIGYRF
ncbi:outer membrane receptor protein involved in Fe transport [Litorivivens lipolytica]|uniref:Outer membrane receptor protein involved in Fe transport n=1 Tax=Litorivivens lipolytica TaxID=1524264 RepID=A0A7W4Z878_9GAMM|nr:TonB-dependent receptor [Litorivivens lipolytica]MBB3048740.1 outer membrane receptor protein involved in Fe transport [Litorivivens lipolytica]